MLSKDSDNCKVLGFVGIDAYDIIHYLSRMILELGDSVLIADCSELHGASGMFSDLNLHTNEITDFRGVDLIRDPVLSNRFFNHYAYVLIDFGGSVDHEYLSLCDEIYVVIDYQLHNIKHVKGVRVNNEQVRYLILRDDLGLKIRSDFILEELSNLAITEENCYFLELDTRDLEAKVMCQYNSVVSFPKISSNFKQMLINILEIDYSKKEVKAALKKAAKGR